jgi:hypothetical protein
MLIKERKNQNEKRREIEDNPVAAERYVKNLYFPSSEQELLDEANENDPHLDIIRILSQWEGKNVEL